MIETSLLKSLLQHEFFQTNKSKLVRTMFPDFLERIYDTIEFGHEKYKRDLTPLELGALYNDQNPAATRAQQQAFNLLLEEVKNAEPIAADIAQDVLAGLWRRETARQIGQIAIDIANGKERPFTEIRTILDGFEATPIPEEKYKVVEGDIDQLLDTMAQTKRWLFNLPELKERVYGIGPGEFDIFYARPETGKTGFWVSLSASPAGWADQGARVHAVCNEEPAPRTMLRIVSSYTGMSQAEIIADRDKAKRLFAAIRDKIRLLDSVDFTVEGLDNYVKLHKPDILIVDQLDKIHIDGTFARTDERLKAIYVYAREIAKRHDIAVVGISQASAEAEGKRILAMDMLENSRTGKAAEADLILGIGKSPLTSAGEDSPERTINVLKNKVTGWHGLVHCFIDGPRSRYIP